MKSFISCLIVLMYSGVLLSQCDIATLGIEPETTSLVRTGSTINLEFSVVNIGTEITCEYPVESVKVIVSLPGVFPMTTGLSYNSYTVQGIVDNGPSIATFFNWTYNTSNNTFEGINHTAIPNAAGESIVLTLNGLTEPVYPKTYFILLNIINNDAPGAPVFPSNLTFNDNGQTTITILPQNGIASVQCLSESVPPNVFPVTSCTFDPVPLVTNNVNDCNQGSQSFTYTFSLCSDQTSTFTWTYTNFITDIQSPVFTCPSPVTLLLDMNCDITVPDIITGLSGIDNCSSVTFDQFPVAGTKIGLIENGTSTVLITAKDCNGNSTTCNVTLTADDMMAPTFICPMGQTAILDINCEITVPDLITGMVGSDNCGLVTFSQLPTPGSKIALSEGGMTSVMVTANDGNGNTTICDVTITADDNIAPFFTCPSGQIIILDSNCEVTVPDVIAGLVGSDNCGTVTFSQSPMAGTKELSNEGGMTIVLVTANDGNGNIATCNVILTADDITSPIFTCPGGQVVLLDMNCGISVPDLITGLTGSDNCGNINFNQLPVAGTNIPLIHGTTYNVLISADDTNGNISTCSVELTASDNTVPLFSYCPPDLLNLMPNNSGCSFNTSLTAPIVSDNCGYSLTWQMTGANVASGVGLIPSPYTFNLGTTEVTYKAVDEAMNETECRFNVQVVNSTVGAISGGGTSIVNSPNPVTVTFTGTGGTLPYTFFYKIGIGGTTQIVTTSLISSIVTIAHPTNVPGTFTYILEGVTDANGCIGTILPNPPEVIVNVISNVDLSPTNPSPLNSNFISSDTNREGYIQFTNGGDGPTNGQVTFRLSKIANFSLSIPSGMMTSGDFPFTVDVDNTNWTITDGLFFFTITALNPNIPAGGNVKIGYILDPTGPAGSSGNLTATVLNGTGGDSNNNNNVSTRTFVIN